MWPSRRDDRGAVAVLVALLFIAMVGFAAISVDVGALWWDRKQLQNGADAAALAIAQDCATNPATCYQAAANSTADMYGDANKSGGAVDVDVELFTGAVRVTTKSPRELWFAPVNNGPSQQQVNASAKASWSKQPDKLKTLPLAVSLCQFKWQNNALSGDPVPGKTVIFKLMTNSDASGLLSWKNLPASVTDALPCIDAPAHNEAGGGFGWLNIPVDSDCEAEISAGGIVNGSPGVAKPSCDLGLKYGEIVEVPVFDGAATVDSGNNAKYKIVGFAAIKLYGWNFTGSDGVNSWPGAYPLEQAESTHYAYTQNPKSHIWGEFVKFGKLAEYKAGTGGANFGLSSIELVG